MTYYNKQTPFNFPCRIVEDFDFHPQDFHPSYSHKMTPFLLAFEKFNANFSHYHSLNGEFISDLCLITEPNHNPTYIMNTNSKTHLTLHLDGEFKIEKLISVTPAKRFDLQTLEAIAFDSACEIATCDQFMETMSSFNAKHEQYMKDVLTCQKRVNRLASEFLAGTIGINVHKIPAIVAGYPNKIKTTRGTLFDVNATDQQLINEIARDWFANEFKYVL